MAVDATELLAGLGHPGGAPAQRHLPVAPTFDVAGVFAAHRDHRLEGVRRAQRVGQGGRNVQAQYRERVLQTLAQAGRRPGVGAVEFCARASRAASASIADAAWQASVIRRPAVLRSRCGI
jgi:hypothetical protein